MSQIKVQCPPQTYSRLFRPWDMAQRNNAATAAAANTNPTQPSIVVAPTHAAGKQRVAVNTNPTIAENLIIKDRLSTSASTNTNTTPTPITTAHTTRSIKVEIVKSESDTMEAESSATEDEEVEVDGDDDGDDDYDDYLHTSRTSDCASSSQSNCSHFSGDDSEHQQRASAAKRLFESKSPTRRLNSSNVTFPHQQQHTFPAHHYPSNLAFEAYHQQQQLHLLSHQHVMSTLSPTASTTTPTNKATVPPTPPASLSNEFMYGASALTRPSDIVPQHPASLIGLPTSAAAAAAATAASFVGMDAYTFGLMEQEYARIMAEEAHLKAVNARKQRPKKFKCPHCDVAFSNNGQLKGHIRIHTGERPFKCDVESCGKTFTRNEELTRHKRIHTGLRPYPCAACGKKFGRRDHLKKHMKTHMPQERQLGPAIFVPMYPYLYGY